MRRAYALDSTIAPSLFHLIQGTFEEDDMEAARIWTGRYLAIDSTSAYPRGLELAGALRFGPSVDSARAAQALDTLSLEVLNQVFFAAPPGRSSLAYSELIGRAATDPRFPAAARSSRLNWLSRQYLRHGQISRWQALDQEADRIEGHEGGLYLLTRARLAGVADSQAIARQERLMARASYPEDADHLAVLLARQGRYSEAQEAVKRLEETADSLDVSDEATMARNLRGLALVYSGQIAAAQGDADTAVDQLRRGLALIPGNWNSERNLHRYTLANLIQDGGDELEALRIYGSLYYSPELEALGYLRRAQLHERRGEREDAVRYYGWFLDLWAEADSHLQPQVELGREALARLGPLDQ